jgi:hypothetical protein
MGSTIAQLPIGQQVSLLGYFDYPVVPEAARPLAKGYECRGRLSNDLRQTAFAAWADVHLTCWSGVEVARTT